MSTRPQEKKPSYKSKYQEKQKVVSKFNFVFDQEKITYKTQIPELPTKLKPKPNQQTHKKKADQIKNKIENLKQKRLAKKSEIKKSSQNFDNDITDYKNKIQLGKKCLVVLNYDLEEIAAKLEDIDQKIQKKNRMIKNLQRPPKQNTKKYQQMTYQQLEVQQQRLSVRVSTAILTKKQQTQINSTIAKLARLKKNAPHGEKQKDNTFEIQAAQESLEKLKNAKQYLRNDDTQIRHKIQSIQQDMEDFQDQIDELEQKKKNPQTQTLYQQSQEIKKQIYALRAELETLQNQFQAKKTQYQYQQAKIQWIKWASQIKRKINQQWQAQKQERRKQRLRQKNKQKKPEQSKGNQKQTPSQQGEKKPQRKKFNKNQKQIDTCTFLISYCQSLIKKEQPKNQTDVQTEKKNIQQALKQDQWSKVKGTVLIKSKKSNPDQQLIQKIKKKKVKKNKQAENVEVEKPTTFSHQFFTQHAFDLVRVVPPTKPEQVEPIIKQLNQKLVYFLENPQGTRQQRQKVQQKQQRYQKYPANQKYNKNKYAPKQKKVVNTQEFPILQ